MSDYSRGELIELLSKENRELRARLAEATQAAEQDKKTWHIARGALLDEIQSLIAEIRFLVARETA